MKKDAFSASGGNKSAERLPLTLYRQRIYIFPNRYGFLFFGFLAAMLVGAINYNNNLAFLLVFMLGGIALTGMLHTYRNLYGLTVVSGRAEPVFAGETAVFSFLIRSGNRSRRALCFFIEKKRMVIENIAEGVETSVRIEAATGHRGRFFPKRLILFTRFPLGLFHAWAILRPRVGCLVYPAPISGAWRGGGEEPTATEGGEKTAQPGADDFAGLIPYQAGHKVGHIAWKALSRGQGAYVKHFTADAGGVVMFDYEAVRAENPERKLSRLCDMVLTAAAMNLTYGLRLPGEIIPPDSGERHRRNCLQRLALFGLPDHDNEE